MPKIVRFHQFGSAEVLKLEDEPFKEPGTGEVRLKVEAHQYMESNQQNGKIIVTVP